MGFFNGLLVLNCGLAAILLPRHRRGYPVLAVQFGLVSRGVDGNLSGGGLTRKTSARALIRGYTIPYAVSLERMTKITRTRDSGGPLPS
jgi:hypothetical protein